MNGAQMAHSTPSGSQIMIQRLTQKPCQVLPMATARAAVFLQFAAMPVIFKSKMSLTTHCLLTQRGMMVKAKAKVKVPRSPLFMLKVLQRFK